jgi:hypothetical protein
LSAFFFFKGVWIKKSQNKNKLKQKVRKNSQKSEFFLKKGVDNRERVLYKGRHRPRGW